MSLAKCNYYKNLSFSSELKSQVDFYTFANVDNLLTKCKENRDIVVNCRSIGILESVNGCFYMKDIEFNCKSSKIRISMVYVKATLPSTIIPYMVQVFGILQFKTEPVIFAKIVQVLDTATGIRLNNVLKSVTRLHLANRLNNRGDIA